MSSTHIILHADKQGLGAALVAMGALVVTGACAPVVL